MSTSPAVAPREWRFRFRAETYAFRFGDAHPPYLARGRRGGAVGERHFGPTDTLRVAPGEFMWGADLLSTVIAGRDLGRDAALRRAVVAYLTAAAEAIVLMAQPLPVVDTDSPGTAPNTAKASSQPPLDHAA